MIQKLHREGARSTQVNRMDNNGSELLRLLFIFSAFLLFRSSDTLGKVWEM